jgi:hypothetical protein
MLRGFMGIKTDRLNGTENASLLTNNGICAILIHSFVFYLMMCSIIEIIEIPVIQKATPVNKL